jgi:hypothetical protein
MRPRKELNDIFKQILGNDHVYFQPPENVKLKYDCIIYSLDSGDIQFADNKSYHYMRRYDVLYICKNPDSELIDKIPQSFPLIRFNRFYASEGLNHYSYTLYF